MTHENIDEWRNIFIYRVKEYISDPRRGSLSHRHFLSHSSSQPRHLLASPRLFDLSKHNFSQFCLFLVVPPLSARFFVDAEESSGALKLFIKNIENCRSFFFFLEKKNPSRAQPLQFSEKTKWRGERICF